MSPIHEAFLAHKDAIRRFLWRYYKRAEDIEDALQETFLRAFAAESRKDIEAPKQFLFQVAKHIALNEIAKKSNSQTESLEDSDISPVLRDETQVMADERLADRQKLAVFAEAVAQLPMQCRRVFMMRKFEGLKAKDIARRLDVSVSSVEKHLAVALVKCTDYLAARGYDVGGGKSQPSGNASSEMRFVKSNDE